MNKLIITLTKITEEEVDIVREAEQIYASKFTSKPLLSLPYSVINDHEILFNLYANPITNVNVAILETVSEIIRKYRCNTFSHHYLDNYRNNDNGISSPFIMLKFCSKQEKKD